MKHIKQFNEASDSNPNLLPTYQDIIDMIDAKQLKMINCDEESIKKYINRIVEMNKERKPNLINEPFDTYMLRRGGDINGTQLASLFDSYCVVVENGVPTAIISEYELMNPFIFGDVVICPGHDSITCYNIETGGYKTGHIR